MSTPVFASISASLSRNANRHRRARWRPTADLPEPMGPMRKMLGLPSMHRGAYRKNAAARRRPRDSDPMRRNQVIVTGIVNTVTVFDSGAVTVTVMLPEPAFVGAVRVTASTLPPTGTFAGPFSGAL